MYRLFLILSLVITGAFLSTPPSARAGSILTYDITIATEAGGLFGGQTLHAFFSYDTDTTGDASSQSSPAGISAPTDVAFTDEDAEISVAVNSDGSSFLQVEATPDTSLVSALSSLDFSTTAFAFTVTKAVIGIPFTQTVTLTKPLPLSLIGSPGGVTPTLMLTTANDSRPIEIVSFSWGPSNIVQRPSVVPEPSTLLLLVSGGLAGLGVRRWRQRRERSPLAAS